MIGLITLFWVFLFLTHFDVSSALACYAPDGSLVTNLIYQPCIAIEGVQSMCCRLNDTSTNIPDQCLTSGLCYSPLQGFTGYWRDYCSDPTWTSPNCLSKDICSNGATSTSTKRVTKCSSNTWCCGNDKSCCKGHNTFTLKPTLVNFGTSATATTTVTPTSNATSSNASSTKIAIGAGVGVPLALLALVMLGVGFWWGRKNASAMYKALETQHGDVNLSSSAYPNQRAIHEVSGVSKQQHFELPDTDNL